MVPILFNIYTNNQPNIPIHRAFFSMLTTWLKRLNRLLMKLSFVCQRLSTIWWNTTTVTLGSQTIKNAIVYIPPPPTNIFRHHVAGYKRCSLFAKWGLPTMIMNVFFLVQGTLTSMLPVWNVNLILFFTCYVIHVFLLIQCNQPFEPMCSAISAVTYWPSYWIKEQISNYRKKVYLISNNSI